MDPGISRITHEEQLFLEFRTQWLLPQDKLIAHENRTMADVIFSNRADVHVPPTTMQHPDKWPYAASRLMAHMGVDSLDDVN